MASAHHATLPAVAPAPSRHAFFEKGFRPFFLLASCLAALMVPFWLLVLAGIVGAPSYLSPTVWHAHEMVFGFAVAVIAGFLLTAVGNWTQRETAVSVRLGWLCALWALGRMAMSAPVRLPPALTALVDLAFLPVLAVVLARPLIAAKNRRNFVVLAVLAALFAANLMTHLDALGFAFATGWQRRGALIAVDVVVLLILIISGRVLPMFTRNATRREDIRSIPALDVLTIAMMALLIAVEALSSSAPPWVVAAIAGATGGLAAARAVHWGTSSTLRQPLLWVLHLGYAWIPIGLLLRAAGNSIDGIFGSMATHALTAGSIGSLTLGMMARVALGHTGRRLEVGRPMTAAFAMVAVAAAARVLAPVLPKHYSLALLVAGVLWSMAFSIYAFVYAPILVAKRIDGRAG